MRRTLIAMLCCLISMTLAVESQEATHQYSIRGKVFDDKGNPVIAATVYFYPTGMGPAVMIPRVKTDESGSFVLEHLQPFTYLVYAVKGQEQFYEKFFSFIADDKSPQVMLTPQSPMAAITLRVRPQGGVIKISVTDALTGCPINPILDIWRTDEPKNHLSGRILSIWTLLAPIEKNVSLSVGADGYKDWYYPVGNNPDYSTPIKLKSGEEMTLDIKLEPIAPIDCISFRAHHLLVITLVSTSVRTGNSIDLRVRNTNNSDYPINDSHVFERGHAVDDAYQYEVWDASGQSLPPKMRKRPGGAFVDSARFGVLKPGESTEQHTTLDDFDMTKPGEYVIQLSRDIHDEKIHSLGIVKSNKVTVTVTP